jgi:uncharacterized protein
MKALHVVTFTLLLVGGLNWLLVGAFGWDIGQFLGGQGVAASRIVYVLIGLAAIAEIVMHKKSCKLCGGGIPIGGIA